VIACAPISVAGKPLLPVRVGAAQSSELPPAAASRLPGRAAGARGEKPAERFICQLDITPILVHSSESIGLSDSVSGKEETR
jgi:hypothetical protein